MEGVNDKKTDNDGDDDWVQFKRMAQMIKITKTLKRRRWTGTLSLLLGLLMSGLFEASFDLGRSVKSGKRKQIPEIWETTCCGYAKKPANVVPVASTERKEKPLWR